MASRARDTYILRAATVSLLVVFLIAAGCVQQSSETLRIGVIHPLSGPAAEFGTLFVEVLEWKAQELQEQGYDIELIIEDSQSDAKAGVNAYNKLVHTEGIDIIFTSLSGVSMALKPLAEQDEVLLWTFAVHPDLTIDSNYVIRHSNTIETEVNVFAEHFESINVNSVGFIHQSDDWGVALKEAMESKVEAESKKIFSEAIDHRNSDFKTTITKIIDQDPDAVMLVAVGPAAGLLIKQTRELGFKGEIYSSVGLIFTPGAADIAGESIVGTYFETYESNEEFVRRYKGRFGKEPATLSHLAFTDLEIITHAIEATRSKKPIDIISHIKSMTEFKGTFENPSIEPNGDVVVPIIIDKWE